MTDFGSLENRRREIRDTLLPRAFARVGREAVAAHVQLPRYRDLVASLKAIETDLESLARLKKPSEAEIEQYYVLRHQRRAGYAEFGEAVMQQLPSEAMPNSFEQAVRKCRAVTDKLAEIDHRLKEAQSPDRQSSPQKRTKASPRPHERESVLSISASPPPPTAFEVPNVPDFGAPLDIPRTIYVPPWYKRVYYTLEYAWDWVQPFYTATVVTLAICLVSLVTYRAFEPLFADRETGVAVNSSELVDEVNVALADESEEPVFDAGPFDRLALGMMGVVNATAAMLWLLRRTRGVRARGSSWEEDASSSLRVYDPTEASAKGRRDWKTPFGSAATPRFEEDEPSLEEPRRLRTIGMRWALPALILVNIGIVGFVRSPSRALNVEPVVVSDAVEEDSSSVLEVATESETASDTSPETTGVVARRAGDDVLVLAGRRLERIRVQHPNSASREVTGASIYWAAQFPRPGAGDRSPDAVLAGLTSNADALRAYEQLVAFSSLRQRRGSMVAGELLTVYRMTGAGTDVRMTDELTADVGELTTIDELVERHGEPMRGDAASERVAAMESMDGPVYWWGSVGAAVTADGGISHVMLRFRGDDFGSWQF